MRKRYKEAEIEIIYFDPEDVVRTSGLQDENDDTTEDVDIP